MNLWDIRKVLIFRPSAKTSVAELNERLIKDVKERGVNFVLSAEDEKSLKKAGANDLLIRAIRENLPKKLGEKILLYQKFLDNYDKSPEHIRIALETAKEFIKKYGISAEDKEIIEYLKSYILELEIH